MRVCNFSAGPSVMPEQVLRKAAAEMLDCRGTGMSVMEMSHRSPAYKDIIDAAESHLRQLMNIPDNYKVLFLQGGASSQFAMVPLNLIRGAGKADYVNTGAWSKKAIAEAKRFGKVHVVAGSEDASFNYIPELKPEMFDPGAAYVHITSNNTIYGTAYKEFPDTGSVPLVADMSSHILSEVIDVSRFGIIYAGAQKNIGPAGLTLVIIREDLVGHASEQTPRMFNYATHVEGGSMFNTPPTYGIYMAGLTFEWLLEQGGVAGIEEKNRAKAAMLYEFIDNSVQFKGTVKEKDRSLMNVPFVLPTEDLNAKFIADAQKEGLVNLKGHRSVGGMRASIFNAMPGECVARLVDFMKRFEQENN